MSLSPTPPKIFALPRPEGAASAPDNRGAFLRTFLDPRAPYLIPLILLALTRAVFWLRLPFAAEDAYITFRYARNLALGLGLVYNPGERVMGFSSPLWTIWSALGYALTRDPTTWARAWTCVADAVTLIGMAHLLERHASRTAAWCFAIFFAGWTYFAAVAMSGMENSAMIALVVVAALAIERRHPLTGLAIAAVALVRPEGVAAAAVLAVFASNRDRLVALAVAGAGFAALGAYFGTIVPQSVRAKVSIYGAPGPLAARHWWDWVLPFPIGQWPQTAEGSILYAMAIVMGPAAALGLRELWGARRTALAAAVAAMVVVWLGYVALGVAYFFWYLAVPLAGVAALAAMGLPRLVRGRAIYVALVLFIAGTWTIVPRIYRSRASAEFLGFGRTAEFLAARSKTWDKVLLEPIGMIGYRCKLVVLDEVGLVSPAIARRRKEGPGWMADVITRERPQWLVVRRGVVERGMSFAGVGAPFRSAVEREAIMRGYHLETIEFADAGDNALSVWRRVP